MLRDGCDFKTAARNLGAWRDELSPPKLREHRHQEECHRARISAAAEKLAEHELSLRLRSSQYIHLLEELHSQAARRLEDLHRSPEHFAGEAEVLWALMASTVDPLRQALAAYYLLAFGRVDERTGFVLAGAQGRNAILGELVARGSVIDDEGRFHEFVTSNGAPASVAGIPWSEIG